MKFFLFYLIGPEVLEYSHPELRRLSFFLPNSPVQESDLFPSPRLSRRRLTPEILPGRISFPNHYSNKTFILP